MDKFEKIKKEIIERAEKISACSDVHKSAYKAETFRELLKGITDNFLHSCQARIIDM